MNLSVNINVCRVCMNPNPGVSLFDDKKLNEMFVFTTRLKPSLHDNMPSLICNKCQTRLRISHNFVKLAQDSEKNLKAFLAKINKDFQLVTGNTPNKDKQKDNGDDDDLLSSMLEEELGDKISHTPDESNKNPVLEEKYPSTTPSLLPNASEVNCANKSSSDVSDSQKQPDSKKIKLNVEDTKEPTGSKLMNLNVKVESTDGDLEDYEFQTEEHYEIEAEEEESEKNEDNVDLHKLSSAETQNPSTSEHETKMLDYTDEDSHVDLEILEENLQQSEDTRSSLDRVEEQPTHNTDGFLKEYQTMLEENDDYLEDNNTMPEDKADSTNANDRTLYDANEELLDGVEEDFEMNAIENESPIDRREVMAHEATTEAQQLATTENMSTVVGEDNSRKTKKSSTKTNARGTSGVKATPKNNKPITSKRFFCYKCNRDFTTKTNLTRHMVTHEGKRPFQCNVCNKSFSQNVTLKQHMYTHTGEKPYKCEVCNRAFTQCKTLVFHLRRHTGEKPFPCEQCGALFRQKDGLKTHILKRHTIKSQHGNTELITCAICKEDLGDNNTLQEHMKKHISDYVRVDSAMSFTNREVNTEVNTNANNQVLLEVIDTDPLHDKPAVLLIEPIPERADDLNPVAHVVDLMTTSALEPSRAKKFQCRQCFKCFAIRKNLMRHLATHETNVPVDYFICKLCDITFSSNEEFRAHTLSEHISNSGEYHKCELCQIVYSSQEELQKHNDLQHAFKCVLCSSMQFTSRSLFVEHMMQHDRCNLIILNKAEIITTFNIYRMEVCRICGGTEVLKCFQGNDQLIDLLRVCANIEVKQDDYLPKHICEQCEFGLRFSYRLRKQSEETEKRLREEAMQTQAITTTTKEIQDSKTVYHEEKQWQPMATKKLHTTITVTTTQQSLPIHVNGTPSNVVTNDFQIAANELSAAQERQVSTSTIESCDDQQQHQKVQRLNVEKSVEPISERFRLELQQRGVFMSAIKSNLLNELGFTQTVIAEKRIRLDIDEEIVNDFRTYGEEFNSNAGVDDDVIEVIEEECLMHVQAEALVQVEEPVECDLNANDYQAQDIIEEIIVSDEDEEQLQTNCTGDTTLNTVVYEEFDEEYVEDNEETVGINYSQSYITKEEGGIMAYDDEITLDAEESGFISTTDDLYNKTEENLSDANINETRNFPGKISNYACPTCNEDFVTQREYREHIKIHGKERFQCLECNKWFPQRYLLTAHEKSHNKDEVRLKCSYCPMSYQKQSNLTRHINTKHQQDRIFICSVCGEQFGRSDVLKRHMQTHSDQRDFQCDRCPEQFKTKQHLDRHLLTHTKSLNENGEQQQSKTDDNDSCDDAAAANDENYSTKSSHHCHICGKISKHHYTHKMHMRIHNQERPHKCDACGKSFRTLASVITHERIHENVRPYQCEHCLLSFRQRGHLNEHRLIHAGIQPHICSICKLSFRKKYNMLVHMRIHSGEHPYKCITCGEQFRKAKQLRKHEQIEHNKIFVGEDKNTEKEKSLQNENGTQSECYTDEIFAEECREVESEIEQENNHTENATSFTNLSTRLLRSDSDDVEIVENVLPPPPPTAEQIAYNEMALEKAIGEGLEQSFSHILPEDFHIDNNNVVLVVDDNDHFSSLFIMDD
ncbi:zinc finger protein 721-like [Eurosta solidaginis]|uniref:zinc finger protein 721-like n=1 Tax=Eurosta solidaginis TaxID=178769 RepID=UPI00353076EF